MSVLAIPPQELVALLIAVSFAAGLNVYATVATLGLLAHTHWLALPPSLQLLGSWWIIGAAAALFAVEFFADKVPAFDLVWNALHTFIRVPVAALLAYQASAGLSPLEQAAAAVIGGTIALAAHGGKTAVRAAVTPSPEPLSNIALSSVEDIGAVGLTWLATAHPYVAGGIALAGVVVTILLIRLIWKALKSLFRGAEHVFAQ
ncbi:DUF4126 domain-containing protein [Terracidiphilus gabretensis]|uniref:DUF4126 domain-containing protein n=1 Tax=Terracidiphilus gabretensis TaxID=1577687 RepID=UPI001E2A5487|nr:DUF4126 domain-containing protein [Terracidiphilus gabretensis]